MEEVVGGIRPQVVMVELDSDRICLLPPGEAMQVGLSLSLVLTFSTRLPVFTVMTGACSAGACLETHQRSPKEEQESYIPRLAAPRSYWP